jgi:hypothetical protein
MTIPSGLDVESDGIPRGSVADSVRFPSHVGVPPVPAQSSKGSAATAVPHSLVSAKRLSELDAEKALIADATIQAELVCSRCEPTEAENAAMRQALQSISDENTELMRQVAGLMDTVNTLGKQKQALKQELTRAREEEPGSEEVKTILEHWLRATGRAERRGRKPNISMAGKRAQTVRKALRFHKGEELLEAIDGLALKPYVGPKGRSTVGLPEQRYDEVEHCMKDEPVVDRFIGYARAAKAKTESDIDSMFEWWQRKAAEQLAAADVVLGELCRRDTPAIADWLDEMDEADKELRAA